MEQSTQTNNGILSKGFFLASLILFILILLPLAGFTGFNSLGLLLAQSFHFPALYLPLYLLAISYYLSRSDLAPFKLWAINLSFLPFITLTMAVRFWLFSALSPLELALKNDVTPLYRLLGILIGATLVFITLALYFWQKPYTAKTTVQKPISSHTTLHNTVVVNTQKVATKQLREGHLHFLKKKVQAILAQPSAKEAAAKEALEYSDDPYIPEKEMGTPNDLYEPNVNTERTEEPQTNLRESLEVNEITSELAHDELTITDDYENYDDYELPHHSMSAVELEESLAMDDSMFSDPALQTWQQDATPEIVINDENAPVMFSFSSTAEENDDFLLPPSQMLTPLEASATSLAHALSALNPTEYTHTPQDTKQENLTPILMKSPVAGPEVLISPTIDVENSFLETKKLYEDDDLLPSYLQGGNLFSPEEQQALNLMAEEIADSADEEEYMGQLIDGANEALNEALSKIEANLNEKLLPSEPLAPIDDSNDWVALAESFNRVNTAYHEAQKASPHTPAPMATLPSPVMPLPSAIRQEAMLGDEDVSDEDLDEVSPSLTPYSPAKMMISSGLGYHVPVDTLLDSYTQEAYWEIDESIEEAGVALENTLKEFKIQAVVTAITKGPAITMFELLPASGVKLSRIEGLADNIAFRLAAQSVRIVAPIPGKQAVGVEIPNAVRALVSFAELANDPKMTNSEDIIPIVLGKDIGGDNQVIDITKTPHLLIAGATGSGKSVCVNALICSILCTRSPQEVRMLLIDPKVVELKPFNDVPHLLTPVITEAKKALQAIQWVNYEMDRRYALLDSLSVRNIAGYNKKVRELALATLPLPYIVVVIDEFADLMATGAKELESLIARLAAKSRAAGIHLVLATQRPSVDVITGLIKANFPSRIAFMVAGKMDSRVILDTNGAEQLLGKGDMLFVSSWSPNPMRIQGAFLSDDEVERIADYVKSLGDPDYIDDEIFMDDADNDDDDISSEDDPLYQEALGIVQSSRKASASYLQRRLKIGYNRAARLIELMEYQGVVGPANGSKAREIL